MIKKGDVWNESREYLDAVTLKKVRQITTKGMINYLPSYHTKSAFSESGEEMIFSSIREGKTVLCKTNLTNGDITCLIEPIDGIGGCQEINRGFGNGRGINHCVISPKRRLVFFEVAGTKVRCVNIDTLEEKTIVEGVEDGMFVESLSVSADEEKLLICLNNKDKSTGHEYKILLKTIEQEDEPYTLYEEKGTCGTHVQFNPVNPNLILFNRDIGGSPCDRVDEFSRAWIYDISQNKRVPVATKEKQNFQTHSTWTWDGEGVVYHGQIEEYANWKGIKGEGGWYIGLADDKGQTVREYSFDKAPYYGHVSAMKGKNAVIIDGNIMDGFLALVYFDEEKPKIEILGRHDTDFTGMTGQYSHPHTICDPSGRWIAYNSSPSVIFAGGNSYIYSMEL